MTAQLMTLQVAERLAEQGWLPDLIVSSDSTRTKQTLDTMAEAHPAFSQADTLFRGSLYTVAALDGQTRKHLQVSPTATHVKEGPKLAACRCPQDRVPKDHSERRECFHRGVRGAPCCIGKRDDQVLPH